MDYSIKASHRTELLVVEFDEKCESSEVLTLLTFKTICLKNEYICIVTNDFFTTSPIETLSRGVGVNLSPQLQKKREI